MKRVLVTGATGFIGRHSLPLLFERGYQVHAASIDAPQQDSADAQWHQAGVHWHQADLLDTTQVARLMTQVQPSHLLHFAWYAAPGKYWTSSENIRWVQASLELLQAFAQHGGQRVVMAGSCAEYDWNYGYCSEQFTPLAPRTLYGTCKHALQMMLQAFAGQAGLGAAWGRIFFLYGPYEHPDRLIASVIQALLRGEPARCSHGNQIRDWLHVQDVADAFVTLLDSDVVGPVNIASGQPASIRQVVYQIADHLHQSHLIRLGALPVPADEPPLLVADVRRLREQVKWEPHFGLEAGLAHTVHWWSQQSGVTEQRP